MSNSSNSHREVRPIEWLRPFGQCEDRHADGTFRKGHSLRFDRKDRRAATKRQVRQWDPRAWFSDAEIRINGLKYALQSNYRGGAIALVWSGRKASARTIDLRKISEVRAFVVHFRGMGAERRR